MSYHCAGLYAEGPTDYRFLCPLITRLVHELCAGSAIVADTAGIDAPHGKRLRRDERVAAAIDEYWKQCTLFIVHGDGAGDPEAARQHLIAPGITRARERHPDLAAVACVPVREIEAWMLVDAEPFRVLARSAPTLPADPESELDPKASLERIFEALGMKRRMLKDSYGFFGENVRIDPLRRLPSFRSFEAELRIAVQRPRS